MALGTAAEVTGTQVLSGHSDAAFLLLLNAHVLTSCYPVPGVLSFDQAASVAASGQLYVSGVL